MLSVEFDESFRTLVWRVKHNNDQTKVRAAAMVTALPVIIAYICFQRFIERGLADGALK